MSVRCRSCNYLITDPWGGGCPLCGAAYPSGGGGGGGGWGGGRTPLYLGLGVVAVLFVGGNLLSRLGGGPAAEPGFAAVQADSTGRIRVGMPVAEAARVLDADAGRRRAAPDAVLARFPDVETRSGTLAWAADGRFLLIRFEAGRVVTITEGARPGGGPERVDVAYDDDDRRGDDEP